MARRKGTHFLRRVSRTILSSSAKCPFSIIRSASSITRNLIPLIALASESSCAIQTPSAPPPTSHYARLTSPIRSQRRPGVATRMSAPRLNCLFCFSTLIPPVNATTLTCLPLSLFLGALTFGSCNSSGKSLLVLIATSEIAARTWSANSRVGAKMSAARRVAGSSSSEVNAAGGGVERI